MAQFGRPTSDITNAWLSGGWADLDEVTPSDSDYADTGDNPSNDVLEVFVGTGLGDPLSSSGHISRWRVCQTDTGVPESGGGTAANLQFDVVQGTTVIATRAYENVPVSWTTQSLTLSSGEADAITDYSDLRHRFMANAGGGSPSNRRGVGISWTELELPDADTTRKAHVTAFELEAENAPRKAHVTAFELETEIPPLTRGTVGLLAVYIANDGTNPFVATDWEKQLALSTVQVDGTTGELEVETGGVGYLRHSGTGSSSRAKRMLQGVLYTPASPPAGAPQDYPSLIGHMETGASGDDSLGILIVTLNDGGGNGFQVEERDDDVQQGNVGGGLPYKARDTDYRLSIFMDGSNQASGHDFDQSSTINITPTALSSGHAGVGGCCVSDWANWKEWWDTKDRNIVCTNLPAGYKLKVRNSVETVLKSATESSGTATLDVIDVDLSNIADIVVTDGSDVAQRIFTPASGEYIVGGDEYSWPGVASRKAHVTAFELEAENAARAAAVTAFELEAENAPRKAHVTAFELEAENAAREAHVTALEIEAADAPREAHVTAFELETEPAARQAHITAFELEVENAPREARVTAFELEVENAPREAHITAFEMEGAGAPRAAYITAFEMQSEDAFDYGPPARRRGLSLTHMTLGV